MRFLRGIFVVLFVSVLSGCITRYASTAAVPPNRAPLLQHVENYYLTRAKEQAAFMARCPLEGVTALVISSKPGYVVVGNRDDIFFAVENSQEISSIGTEGCGQRMLFQVICGPSQNYGSVATTPHGQGCDVVAGAAASRVIQRNDEQHRQQQEEAR